MAHPLARLMASAGDAVRNIPFYFGGAHHGASKSLRDVSGWYAARGSADGDLLPDQDELRYRARDIHRNNGFAHSIVQKSVDNIIGTGLRLSAQPDYLVLQQALGPRFDKKWADEFAALYEALFHEWWWSTACHAGDTKTGDMLCEEFQFAKFNNGGVLILPLWLPDRGDGFATKLKTVEIDRLSNPDGCSDRSLLRGGIEFNRDHTGEPIAYHIRNCHPGDHYMTVDVGDNTWQRIPRKTSFGRLRVIHDFDSDRPDQTRGKPLLSAVLDQFKNIDRYTKAEIRAAIANACIWGAITTPLEHEEIEALFQNDREEYMKARAAHEVRMEPGMLATLFPGDRLEPMVPQRPAAQYGVFTKNIFRIIAAGGDMPYEVAMGDFSDSNYSNTRAALNEFWRSVSRRRDRLGAGTLDPINGLFMEEMVNAERIEAPRFYEFRRAYQRCIWIGPGRGYVDKVKEAQGDLIMLSGNTTTLQKVCAEQGMHWREVLDQIATERAYMSELGIAPASVASSPPINNVPGDEPQPDDDEQDPVIPNKPQPNQRPPDAAYA